MRYLYSLLGLIFVLVAIGFAALNSHPVNINYYVGTSHLALPALLFAVLLIGVILGTVVMLPTVIKAKFQARKHRRAAKQTSEEVDNLRRMPIQEDH